MSRSPGQRNRAAMARAIVEGHRAFVQPGGWVRVVSHTRPGKRYRVEFAAARPGGPVAFSCRPEGTGAYSDDHLQLSALGVAPCKHAALAARRLRRERLARWDDASGEWVASERLAPSVPVDEDPFACFR